MSLRRSCKTVILTILFTACHVNAQKVFPFRIPDTGQFTSYTTVRGSDSDFIINPQSFKDNGDGTVTDYITGLMWQETDGGEMTFGSAQEYVKNLSLGGYKDWRLPANHELFDLNNFDNVNPALNTSVFTKTAAEYWWTSETRVDDTAKVWVVNAGGGTGAHPKSETKSAGGTKLFHVRAVRDMYTTAFNLQRFTDNGNGTITDNYTGLVWQKNQPKNTMTWEEALQYSSTVPLAGKTDWRLPNIKELQSLSDEAISKPSFNRTFFPDVISGNFWSSTTLQQATSRAWDINVEYGIVSYNEKTVKENVLLVRGGNDNQYLRLSEAIVTGGEYEMGDHFGFVDPSHPSDEVPVHKVKVNSFLMQKTEVTNEQFIAFLNSMLLSGKLEVKNNTVFMKGSSDIICYTNQYEQWYSIGYDGKAFYISDFRLSHPAVGVMWYGAAAFCNWLSISSGLQECYTLSSGVCDFTKNGYRLPTEAEWEYAGRGGNLNPYLIYPYGNTIDTRKANLPASGDPYETTSYPNTTPAGFYDGRLKLKSEYNWPGSALSYQTSDGANGYGIYDMQGNVWEFVNDWYGQNYYSTSEYDNPKGPSSGFLMPDGKPYRGMRGGNWYNGLLSGGVNDGHSRVANRNPSYYRGPQDPNHPYYHLGFRTSRNYMGTQTGVLNGESGGLKDYKLSQNYPNPFNPVTTISFMIPAYENVRLAIYNSIGQAVETLINGEIEKGEHSIKWNAGGCPSGIYFAVLRCGEKTSVIKMTLIK